MNAKLSVTIALLAGLLGGLLTRYIAPPAAFAQNQAPIVKEIRAQSFTLVDETGGALGTFKAEPVHSFPNPAFTAPAARIVLRDSTGREIWSAGGNAIRQLSER
jgi:hypothetical protein